MLNRKGLNRAFIVSNKGTIKLIYAACSQTSRVRKRNVFSGNKPLKFITSKPKSWTGQIQRTQMITQRSSPENENKITRSNLNKKIKQTTPNNQLCDNSVWLGSGSRLEKRVRCKIEQALTSKSRGWYCLEE